MNPNESSESKRMPAGTVNNPVLALPFKTIFIWLLLALPAGAQSPAPVSNSPPAAIQTQTHRFLSPQQVEDCRADCIEHRRIICGKILKVLPAGLVVDSGYTNLMRPPLNRSWLVPGDVAAQPAANLVEGHQPDCVCVGQVFLTDLPKKPRPKLYDYVILEGFPTGPYTYTSVGDLRRTVRSFSTKLPKSVRWKLDEIQKESRTH